MLTSRDIPGLDEVSSIDFEQRPILRRLALKPEALSQKRRLRDSQSRKGIKQFIQAGNALPILRRGCPADPR